MSSTAFVWLRRFARHARQANGANVTVTFALATVPLVGFVGAAVDYSHANSVKAAMQAAVDGTALMLSKQAASMNEVRYPDQGRRLLQGAVHPPGSDRRHRHADLHDEGGSKIVVGATRT